MKAQQEQFSFDLFDMSGFTQAKVGDFDTRRQYAAREETKRKADAERRRAERHEREQRERAEQHERERRQRESSARHGHRQAGRSYWDILGVMCGTDAATIRTAWKQRCKECHPDNAGGGNVEEMKEINRAYSKMRGKR